MGKKFFRQTFDLLNDIKLFQEVLEGVFIKMSGSGDGHKALCKRRKKKLRFSKNWLRVSNNSY